MEREEAAATAVVEPEVLTPEVETQAPKSATKNALSLAGSNLMSKFTGGGDTVNALSVWAEASGQKQTAGLFPVLTISGGESGGQLMVPDWQDEDVSMKLPQGRKPCTIVYLTYRMEIIGWPANYDDKAKTHAKPAYSCVVPGDDAELVKLANKAAKNYQFTKSDAKEKFDVGPAGDGPGHIRPCLELLGYSPDLKGLVVLRTLNLWGSVNSTIANLARHVDPAQQQILPFVAVVRPETQTETSKGRNWPNHFFNFTADVTKAGAAIAEEFKGWLAGIQDDSEVLHKVEEWRTGADRPITDVIKAKLFTAANL